MVKTASYFKKRENFANFFSRAEIRTADFPVAVHALYLKTTATPNNSVFGKFVRTRLDKTYDYFVSMQNHRNHFCEENLLITEVKNLLIKLCVFFGGGRLFFFFEIVSTKPKNCQQCSPLRKSIEMTTLRPVTHYAFFDEF